MTRGHALKTLTGFGLASLAGASSAEASPGAAVVGAWKLETFDVIAKDGSRQPRYGVHPLGYLMYSASGRVSAILSARHRTALEPPGSVSASELACIESVRPFLAYAGTYHIRGNHVFHTVETSVFTNLVGTTLEREFSLQGDLLTIRTLPPEIWGSANILTWRRT